MVKLNTGLKLAALLQLTQTETNRNDNARMTNDADWLKLRAAAAHLLKQVDMTYCVMPWDSV
jgi:hypothetical protein